jgi:acyl-CoA thioester hydrolase
MTTTPLVYTSTQRIRFSELDPYDHVSTASYARIFVDHRMDALRDSVGWDHETLAKLPFMAWVRRMEIEFARPARADQEITLTSFVRDFRGSDAHVECAMLDTAGKLLARCVMTIAYVERATQRSASWPADIVSQFSAPAPRASS